MQQPNVSTEEMQQRIVRFEVLKERGIPIMFIDSILPGHHRMNYAVIGDTASEEREYDPAITSPHKFQIGIVNAPPGNGPGYHTHDYIEAFMPLTGEWRFYWGNDPEAPDEPDGEAIIGQWDLISLPSGLWRGFENISNEDAWILGILEEHTAFTSKDPYWSPEIIRQAEERGFSADDKGQLVRPVNYDELKVEMEERLHELLGRK